VSSYATLEIVKGLLGIPPEDTSMDVALQASLDATEAAILTACGFVAEPTLIEDRVQAPRESQVVSTTKRPLEESTVLVHARHCATEWAPIDRQVLDAFKGKLKLLGPQDCPCSCSGLGLFQPQEMYRWRGRIYWTARITYTALPMETAYGGTAPADFVMAINRAAAAEWQQIQGISGAGGAAGAGGLDSLTVGQISESYSSGEAASGGASSWLIAPGLKQSLAPYVRGASRARVAW
jgi:hypothetical protein